MRIITILLAGVFFLMCDGAIGQSRKKKSEEPPKVSKDQALKAESTFIEAEKQLILENYTKAYDLFLLADELNPNNAAIQYKLAEVLVKNGEFDKSLSHIQKAIELDGQNRYYYLYKAEILKITNDFMGAARVYQDLMSKIPGNNKYLYELASIYMFEGNWDRALKTYLEIEEEFGASHDIMLEKQKIYLRNNDMQSLTKDWDSFIAQNPGSPTYTLEFCNVLIANDMIEEAKKRLDGIRTEYPDNKQVFLLLSEIERQQDNYQEALELLSEPLNSMVIDIEVKIQLLGRYMDSEDPEIIQVLENRISDLVNFHAESFRVLAFAGDFHLENGSSESALEHYLRAVRVSPGNYSVWQNIINLEAEAGLYDSLLEHSEEALEYFPNQSIFYYFNGFANYIKENYKRAAYSLEQGKKFTNDPGLLTVFYGQLGDVYHSLDDNSKSDEAYESALINDPTNFHVLNNYSYYLSLRGEKLDEALKMCEKLISNNPENGTYLDTYGWVLYVSGDYQKAAEVLKKAHELLEDGTITEHYGDVLFKLGKVDQAIEKWEQAREQGGTSENIDKKISDKKLYE